MKVDPAGALGITAAGLGVLVDGTTISIVDDKLSIVPPAHVSVMGRISIGI